MSALETKRRPGEPGLVAHIVGAIFGAGVWYFVAVALIVRFGFFSGLLQGEPPWPVHLIAIAFGVCAGFRILILNRRDARAQTGQHHRGMAR